MLYGITPYTYVLNKKIEFAKKLFVDTSLTVKEVATKLCFSDAYYFPNVFKEKVGCAPSQYRKSHTGNQA
jgi:AraC-like DNA-binding protein